MKETLVYKLCYIAYVVLYRLIGIHGRLRLRTTWSKFFRNFTVMIRFWVALKRADYLTLESQTLKSEELGGRNRWEQGNDGAFSNVGHGRIQ